PTGGRVGRARSSAAAAELWKRSPHARAKPASRSRPHAGATAVTPAIASTATEKLRFILLPLFSARRERRSERICEFRPARTACAQSAPRRRRIARKKLVGIVKLGRVPGGRPKDYGERPASTKGSTTEIRPAAVRARARFSGGRPPGADRAATDFSPGDVRCSREEDAAGCANVGPRLPRGDEALAGERPRESALPRLGQHADPVQGLHAARAALERARVPRVADTGAAGNRGLPGARSRNAGRPRRDRAPALLHGRGPAPARDADRRHVLPRRRLHREPASHRALPRVRVAS